MTANILLQEHIGFGAFVMQGLLYVFLFRYCDMYPKLYVITKKYKALFQSNQVDQEFGAVSAPFY